MRLSGKDMTEVLDGDSLSRVNYQLRILNQNKKMDSTTKMIERGFIPHTASILVDKRHHHSTNNYSVLTKLMGFFSEMVKLSKLVKNPPLFSNQFLVELLHLSESGQQEYVEYIVKCFTFLKDLSANKDLLQTQKLNPGAALDNPHIKNILQVMLLNGSQEKAS